MDNIFHAQHHQWSAAATVVDAAVAAVDNTVFATFGDPVVGADDVVA